MSALLSTEGLVFCLVALALFPLMQVSHAYSLRFVEQVREAMTNGLPPAERDLVLTIVDENAWSGLPLVGLRIVFAPVLLVLVRVYGRTKALMMMGAVVLTSLMRKQALSEADATALGNRLHDNLCGCDGSKHGLAERVPVPAKPMPPDVGRPGMRYAYWLVSDARDGTIKMVVYDHDPSCTAFHGFDRFVVLHRWACLAPWEAERFARVSAPDVRFYGWDLIRLSLDLPGDAVVIAWPDDEVYGLRETSEAIGRVEDALDDNTDDPEICTVTGPWFVASKAELDARHVAIDSSATQAMDAEFDA